MNLNAKKWIKALRSRKYKQATGRLAAIERDGDKEPKIQYCCLGVACDLAVKAGIKISVKKFSDEIEFGGQSYFLPEQVRIWLGLRTNRGHFEQRNRETDLADLNDEGKSFHQIARIIEREPEGMFRTTPKKKKRKTA